MTEYASLRAMERMENVAQPTFTWSGKLSGALTNHDLGAGLTTLAVHGWEPVALSSATIGTSEGVVVLHTVIMRHA